MIDIDASPEIIDFENGEVILFDKPLKWSSFDVIRQIKSIVPIKKIGHAGTLDPLAEGLLILCTGKKTRSIQEYQNLPKVYTGTLQLGVESPSYDLETPVTGNYPIDHIDDQLIRETVAKFTGEIIQQPPVFSAIKLKGKRAYQLAKKGKNPVLEGRKVSIYDFQVNAFEGNQLTFTVKCSKGTYIRSLVHDFGKSLGSAAVLTWLQRTQIGDFHIKKAVNFASFKNIVSGAKQVIL
ncbi:MAG TPA: tRNA pseudouridine(55) synthase TruB [Bacteroidia bacterium]|nr:tRNA pseudouridine(55) synthase TruB [Bacteroidia bacterium]HRS59923.1 tRNA pseudouridine(55) synthase TruB [Bacteroidia bacterium]HRU69253.1 tRNA pseudouridine(55) synthase TruB [Bacteroidia bacterium]